MGYAQSTTGEDRVAGGVKAGVNGSAWVGRSSDLHLGLALGGFVDYRVQGAWAVQAELAMVDKGADFTGPTGETEDEALIYLELPVFGRYDIPLTELATLYGLAGPGVALLVDSKRTRRGDLRRVDVTGAAGIGVDLYTPQHYISVELRASMGVLDILDDRRRARNFMTGVWVGVTL